VRSCNTLVRVFRRGHGTVKRMAQFRPWATHGDLIDAYRNGNARADIGAAPWPAAAPDGFSNHIFRMPHGDLRTQVSEDKQATQRGNRFDQVNPLECSEQFWHPEVRGAPPG
jgi:hypothetical protein